MNPGTRKIAWLIFLAIVFGMIFFLRLPSFSDSICDPDLGTPAYTSRLLLEGRCPYSDAVITKPPGTVALYAIVFGLLGLGMIAIHLLAAVWICACAGLLFLVGKRLAGIWGGAVSAGLYAMYQADLASAGACANFETWALLPAVGCLALLINADREKALARAFFAGVLACLAVWMKQTALFFGLVAGAVYLYDAVGHGRAKPLAGFAAGVACCCIPFLLMTASVGCTLSMFETLNPLRMGAYLFADAQPDRWARSLELVGRFARSNLYLIVLVAAGLLVGVCAPAVRPRLDGRKPVLVILFLMASIGSAAAGGRFYGHYFVVLFPFLCLAAGLVVGALVDSGWRKAGVALVALMVAGALTDSAPQIRLAGMSAASLAREGSVLSASIFEANRNGEILPDDRSVLVGQLEWQQVYRQVARRMREELKPGQTIWCVDYMPEMYTYARAFSPTRHQEHFEIFTQSANPHHGLWFHEVNETVRANRAQLMTELSQAPPEFIVRLAFGPPWPPPDEMQLPANWPKNIYGRPMSLPKARMKLFGELAAFLDQNYVPVSPPISNAVTVYRLVKE